MGNRTIEGSMEKGKIKIYCFFRLEEYMRIFTLTEEEEKEYRELMNSDEYEYGMEYQLADGFLEKRGVYTQDPSLTYIITDGILLLDDKGELFTQL